MNKTFLIIQREFLSRVKKKSFLITTLLVPLIFPSIFAGIFYFMKKDEENTKIRKIEVIDESSTFDFMSTDNFEFRPARGGIEHAKTTLQESDNYALLYIPAYNIESPQGFTLYTKSNPNFSVINTLESKLESTIKEQKLNAYNINQATLDKLKTNINLNTLNISEGEEKESDAVISFVVGYFTGFLIYIFMFAYGAQVMQGVLEEKSNKIVEVVVSTVKPFQLMLGKILGIAAVGLFQVVLWITLMVVISTVLSSLIGIEMPQSTQMTEATQNLNTTEEGQKLIHAIMAIPFTQIIICFIFYFLGGYLLYGSLFAAIGSAVDTPSEAQQFTVPIMMPLIAGIAGMSSIISNPDGSFSFWLSIIPLTSPIAMMGRIGFGVPWWELLLSMTLLVLGFISTVWFAGRIYRIGILSHGTKTNYKTLAKWLMMKH